MNKCKGTFKTCNLASFGVLSMTHAYNTTLDKNQDLTQRLAFQIFIFCLFVLNEKKKFNLINNQSADGKRMSQFLTLYLSLLEYDALLHLT